MKFIDTNVFLRYLLWDDPVKAEACRKLFKKAIADEKRDNNGKLTPETLEAAILFGEKPHSSYNSFCSPCSIKLSGIPNLTN